MRREKGGSHAPSPLLLSPCNTMGEGGGGTTNKERRAGRWGERRGAHRSPPQCIAHIAHLPLLMEAKRVGRKEAAVALDDKGKVVRGSVPKKRRGRSPTEEVEGKVGGYDDVGIEEEEVNSLVTNMKEEKESRGSDSGAMTPTKGREAVIVAFGQGGRKERWMTVDPVRRKERWCVVLDVGAREVEIYRFNEQPPEEQRKRPSNVPIAE